MRQLGVRHPTSACSKASIKEKARRARPPADIPPPDGRGADQHSRRMNSRSGELQQSCLHCEFFPCIYADALSSVVPPHVNCRFWLSTLSLPSPPSSSGRRASAPYPFLHCIIHGSRRGCQLRISTVPALARRASQQHRWLRLRTADGAAGQLSAADLPPDSGRAYEEPIQVFPRLRERDPYRCGSTGSRYPTRHWFAKRLATEVLSSANGCQASGSDWRFMPVVWQTKGPCHIASNRTCTDPQRQRPQHGPE